MNNIVLCISIAIYAVAGSAQTPEPKRYNFTHYTAESGLVSYQVNSTVQDEQGYIWIATNEGLQRFDGIRYKNFRHREDDPSSLPSRSIIQLLPDKNKNLWLLTMDGKVGLFNTKSFVFREAEVKVKNETLLGSLTTSKKLVTDEEGNVFLLLPGKELVTYNPIDNEFSAANNFFTIKPEWQIVDFLQQPGTKKYWMCLSGKGFAVYNRATDQLSYHGNNAEEEKIIAQYKNDTNPFKLFFDSRGRIWHGGMFDGLPYLYCYDPKQQKAVLNKYGFSEEVPRYHEVQQFMEQRDGSIWISGIHILARYLEDEKQFQQVYNGYLDEHSIEFVVITNLFEDREHSIWVGTGNNGLYRFNPSEEFFSIIEHRSKLTGNIGSGAPLTFVQDLDSSILVGVWNDGLYRYDKDLKPIPLDIKGFPVNEITPILDMSLSGKGEFIWMAAANGIYKYDQRKRQVQYYHLPRLKSRIRDIEEDKKGDIWLGLQEHGVYKWDITKGEIDSVKGISNFDAIPPVRVYKIMVDRKGLVWVGTSTEGLYLIDPETDRVVQHFDDRAEEGLKLRDQMVAALLDYNDSLLIIGTSRDILTYNRSQKKLAPLGNDKAISGFVQSMEKDNAGYVWLSSTTGLYRVNIQNKVFVKFDRNDGITYDYFVISASRVLPDGRMLFGATASIVVFDPATIHIDTGNPVVNITDFKVLNRSLPVDSLLRREVIELAPNENSITIDLSAMSYNTGYVIRYKLEGLEDMWKVTNQTNQLVYSYLPAGNYTLRLSALNTDGTEEPNPLALKIRVTKPFWKTWGFYSLLILLAGSILFWLDKARLQRKEAVQKMRSDIAANLHTDVNTALGNINILSEMAKMKAQKDPKKSSEFIDQIYTKSQNMITSMDDMLWSISPENDSMERTVQRLREYIEDLNGRYSTTIEMLVDDKVKTLKLDMQFRHEGFLLFKEISKGLLNAGASGCKIHLTLEKPNLLFTIHFTNADSDQQQINNLPYTADLAKRLDILHAKINTHLRNSHSEWELKIPIRK